MNIKKITIIGLLATILLSACTAKEPDLNTKFERPVPPPTKEVEVFVVGENIPELNFEKTGNIESQDIINITSQLAGQVQAINVEVGDTVNKDNVLIELGGSLNSEIAALQEKTALENQKLTEINRQLTENSGFNTRNAAVLNVNAAYDNYQSALKNKQNTLDLFDQQYENSQIEVENAELGYDNSLNTIDTLEDSLDDLDDQYDDLKDDIDDAYDNNAPDDVLDKLYDAKDQIKASIDQLENQIDAAEIAAEVSYNRTKQAELATEQLVSTYNSNFTQLDTAIQNSKTQYEAAINQLETANNGALMQQVGAELQSLQAQSNLESAQLNKQFENIKSPINGVVTEITVETSNLINPGQVLITIENTDQKITKTGLTPEEAEFIKNGDKVEIIYNDNITQGTITSIAPILNTQSRKIDIEIAMENNNIPANAFVKIKFQPKQQYSFFIPLNSIVLIDGGKHVRYINDNNEVAYKKISIGELFGEYVEVTSGIKKGDIIITSTEIFLNDQEEVKIKQ